MKIPDSALNGISDLLASSLPYEDDYQAQTKQAKIVDRSFNRMVAADESLSKWQGFVWHLLKKIDGSEKMQNTIDAAIADFVKDLENEI